jgi:hypothetical protein
LYGEPKEQDDACALDLVSGPSLGLRRLLLEEVREPNLSAGPLDVLLHLPPVLPEGEGPVGRRLAARADGRVVGRAEEVGGGEALRLGVGHHLVLHALVPVVAPRLHARRRSIRQGRPIQEKLRALM